MKDGDVTNGNRTHEPSLRELTAELDGLRQLMEANFRAQEKLNEERDKRYTERDTSRQAEVQSALVAAKEQTASAFAASKEATSEAKKAQDQYNVSHNDLLRKTERQAEIMITRDQVNDKFESFDEKITDLKGQVVDLKGQIGVTSGHTAGTKSVKDESRANLALLIAVVIPFLAIVVGGLLKIFRY